MNKEYFVVELAHSLHGRVQRIHVSYKALGYLCGTLLVLLLLMSGLCFSYMRMSWKASHYNQLLSDFDGLRSRYRELQRLSRQHSEQMASLETLASEVTAAYGINDRSRSQSFEEGDQQQSITPNVKESIEEYNFLKAANFGSIYHRYAYQWQSHDRPSLWPVHGVLRSPFGGRNDPFSGEGAFHTGIDLAVPVGTPVDVTADGIVVSAGWSGDYGKLVVVDHGNGLETYYAHLSQVLVVAGEEVRRGEVIALSGGTGRATGPHIHYEVRLHGTPVNPYRFLTRPRAVQARVSNHSDLDLGL